MREPGTADGVPICPVDGRAMTDPAGFAQIDAPYLLLTFIPFYVDEADRVWLDRSWLRDFERHSEYIRQLTLVAPRHPYRPDIADLVPVGERAMAATRFVGLKPQTSLRAAMSSLPNTVATLWREVRRSQIVHSGIAGWPFPLGWIANPISLIMRRRLVLVVESSPWRISGTGPRSLKHRLMSWTTERLGAYFMNRADLAIATQPAYLTSLRAAPRRGRGFVNPASWINEDEILPDAAAQRSWTDKMANASHPPAVLFAGRLTQDKGVEVLLEAIGRLQSRGTRVRVDIIGEGPLRDVCEKASRTAGAVAVRLLDPVPYGAPFFELLQRYHAVVVPSLGQEQPRILFDAYSQAVPVIASGTDGIRPHVTAGVTGWLVRPGDAAALAEAIDEFAANVGFARDRGLAARHVAEQLTHRAMHRTRSVELARLLS